jgi:hypothetical protein
MITRLSRFHIVTFLIGCLACLLAYFCPLDPLWISMGLRCLGYSFIFLLCVLAILLHRGLFEDKRRTILLWIKDCRWWLLIPLICFAFSQSEIRSEFRIIWDEYVIASTAKMMHAERVPVALFESEPGIEGPIASKTFVDKRPFLYPFLVSCVHDVFGYQIRAPFWVNKALGILLFFALFGYAWLITGSRTCASLLPVLMASIPLLHFSINSGAMEVLSLLLFVCFAISACFYLRSPNGVTLDRLCIVGLLVVQSRYEGMLLVPIGACLVLLGWRLSRRIELSWMFALVPIFLIPSVLHHRMVGMMKGHWQLLSGTSSRFSLEYLPKNVEAVFDFMFSGAALLPNAPVISWLGLLLPLLLLYRFKKQANPADCLAVPELASVVTLVVACFSVAVLLLFYYWSSFMHPMASRFALYPYLGIAVLFVWVFGYIVKETPRIWLFLVPVLMMQIVVFTVPSLRRGPYEKLLREPNNYGWSEGFVDSLPKKRRVILTYTSFLPWVLRDIHSTSINYINNAHSVLRDLWLKGSFEEWLIIQAYDTNAEGLDVLTEASILPPEIETRRLMEYRKGHSLFVVSKIVGWKASAAR